MTATVDDECLAQMLTISFADWDDDVGFDFDVFEAVDEAEILQIERMLCQG